MQASQPVSTESSRVTANRRRMDDADPEFLVELLRSLDGVDPTDPVFDELLRRGAAAAAPVASADLAETPAEKIKRMLPNMRYLAEKPMHIDTIQRVAREIRSNSCTGENEALVRELSWSSRSYLGWIRIPIFVSSTFMDQHGERDCLTRCCGALCSVLLTMVHTGLWHND